MKKLLLLALLVPLAAKAQTFPGQAPGPGYVPISTGTGAGMTWATTFTAPMTFPGGINVPSLPGLSSSVQGSGIPGLDNGSCSGPTNCGWLIFQTVTTPPIAIPPALRVQRQATYSGGATGEVRNALWVLTSTSRQGAYYEWPLLSEMHNYTEGATAAQNVAINGTAFKQYLSGFTGEIGPTWAGNFNCSDVTSKVNPRYSCVGVEIDNSANPDAGTDNLRQRVNLQLAWGSQTGSATSSLHFGVGILMGSNDASVMDRAIFMGGAGAYQIGLDTSQASFSIASIFMGSGQRIVFDGTNTGTYSRSLYYSSAILAYQTPSGVMFAVDDVGNSSFGGKVLSLEHIASGASSTVTAGEISYGGTTVAPNAATCPTGTIGTKTIIGCEVHNIAGTTRYVPYF